MYGMDRQTNNKSFRVLTKRDNPKARLVCFPHAGGAASFFRSWPQYTPNDIELIAVRYPGREDRLLEDPAESMSQLATPLAAECATLLDKPLMFFGHSMGASVAYEIAQILQSSHDAPLLSLFVSGRSGPQAEKLSRGLGGATDEELMADVRLLGGTESQAFDDPELRQLVLPAIRADYRLIEKYDALPKKATLSSPVVAYYGSSDPDLTQHGVATWSSVTVSTFDSRSFDGGHFYLVDHLQELADDLYERSERFLDRSTQASFAK